MAELGKEDGDEMPDDNKVVIVEDEAPQEEKAEEIEITETAPEEPKKLKLLQSNRMSEKAFVSETQENRSVSNVEILRSSETRSN